MTEREIATGAVRSSEIRTGAVGRSEVRTGAIGPSEIRTDGVRAREIRQGAVSADEIQADAVDASKIADGAIGTAQLAPGAVGSARLFDDAVTAPKLAADSVTGENVVNGSLALADLAATVSTVTYDPPVMNPGDCASESSLAVTNKQAGDVALVLPGGNGWNSDLTLDGYASTGSGGANAISVVVCRTFGAGSVDPGPQPLTVLLFR